MYSYTYSRRLHWSECDPAGIIFFPVYARWVSEGLHQLFLSNGIDPNAIQDGSMVGLPAVSLSMKFHSAPRLHEEVSHVISVEKLGGKSLCFHHEFRSEERVFMEAEDVRIWTTHILGVPDSLKSTEIPSAIRTLLEGSSNGTTILKAGAENQ